MRNAEFEKFIEAMQKQPPSPCTDCESFQSCKNLELSCAAYGQYIRCKDTSGYPREPSSKFYQRHFRRFDNNSHNQDVDEYGRKI